MKYTFLLFPALLLALQAALRAELGLPRNAYGVWDRSGYNTVAQYPFTRGQAYSESLHGGRQWSPIDVGHRSGGTLRRAVRFLAQLDISIPDIPHRATRACR